MNRVERKSRAGGRSQREKRREVTGQGVKQGFARQMGLGGQREGRCDDKEEQRAQRQS